MLDWITIDEATIFYLAVFSIISFLASLMIIPVLVIRIPEDYFAEKNATAGSPGPTSTRSSAGHY